MRTLATIITIITISFSTAFANVNPDMNITEENVSISSLDIFSSADFDNVSENLVFTTVKEISTVQILSSTGDIEFILPVMSDNVQINKSLFGKGNFKIGFILEGNNEVFFTDVTIK